MSQQEEFYPMPMFPTLSVADIDKSTSWYSDKLGFWLIFTIPGQKDAPVLTHLRWAKYADLLLVQEDKATTSPWPKGVGMTLSFRMEEETIDEMVQRLQNDGVEIAEGPVSRAWNTREIAVVDPDGYRLVFFEPINTDLSMDKVMENIRRGETAT